MGSWFCTSMIFKNPIKTCLSIRNMLFTIYMVRVWIVTEYFLFKQQALIGLLMVINYNLQLDFINSKS